MKMPRLGFSMDKKTRDNLKALSNIVTVKELTIAAGLGADIIRDEAIRNAPVGPTGNLKKNIVARVDKTKTAFGGKGYAYVGAVYKGKGGGGGDHAHLVEFGGRGGEMPANPFMRKAVESKRAEVKSFIEADILHRMKRKLK